MIKRALTGFLFCFFWTVFVGLLQSEQQTERVTLEWYLRTPALMWYLVGIIGGIVGYMWEESERKKEAKSD